MKRQLTIAGSIILILLVVVAIYFNNRHKDQIQTTDQDKLDLSQSNIPAVGETDETNHEDGSHVAPVKSESLERIVQRENERQILEADQNENVEVDSEVHNDTHDEIAVAVGKTDAPNVPSPVTIGGQTIVPETGKVYRNMKRSEDEQGFTIETFHVGPESESNAEVVDIGDRPNPQRSRNHLSNN